MVEVGCLAFLSSVLVDCLLDTGLTFCIISNTLKSDMPIVPESKSLFHLDTSCGKQLVRRRKTITQTAAVESARAMVALPGGPGDMTTLALCEELRWDVNVWMTKGLQKNIFMLIYNMHSEVYIRVNQKKKNTPCHFFFYVEFLSNPSLTFSDIL